MRTSSSMALGVSSPLGLRLVCTTAGGGAKEGPGPTLDSPDATKGAGLRCVRVGGLDVL